LGDVILEGLYREWETTGPPGTLRLKILALRLETSVTEILESVAEAMATGLVALDRKRTALYLTPQGYDTLFHAFSRFLMQFKTALAHDQANPSGCIRI